MQKKALKHCAAAGIAVSGNTAPVGKVTLRRCVQWTESSREAQQTKYSVVRTMFVARIVHLTRTLTDVYSL